MLSVVADRVACLSVCLSVCLTVCLLVTTVKRAKTAQPIEMPFGILNRVGPENHVLEGIQIPHNKRHFKRCMMTLGFSPHDVKQRSDSSAAVSHQNFPTYTKMCRVTSSM